MPGGGRRREKGPGVPAFVTISRDVLMLCEGGWLVADTSRGVCY